MKLSVTIPGSGETLVEAREGWTVMEAIRDAGLPITAQCGGGKACATCHVHIGEEFLSKMPVMDDEEESLLELSESYDTHSSRLSCQIICQADLDGLVVTLQTDSVEF